LSRTILSPMSLVDATPSPSWRCVTRAAAGISPALDRSRDTYRPHCEHSGWRPVRTIARKASRFATRTSTSQLAHGSVLTLDTCGFLQHFTQNTNLCL